MTLNELADGCIAQIESLAALSPDLEAKLRELGFSEGDEVEIVARGPLGGQPLAVRLNRRLIALRDEEASAIRLKSMQ